MKSSGGEYGSSVRRGWLAGGPSLIGVGVAITEIQSFDVSASKSGVAVDEAFQALGVAVSHKSRSRLAREVVAFKSLSRRAAVHAGRCPVASIA
jgi:hypothetical protein